MASAHTTASAVRYAKSQRGVAFLRKDEIARYALQSPLTLRESETIWLNAQRIFAGSATSNIRLPAVSTPWRPSGRLRPADMRTQDVRPPSPGVVALRGQKERVRPMDPIDVKHDFETLENAVRRHVVDALALARGNQRQAAVLLAVSRWKLARLVKRFELR